MDPGYATKWSIWGVVRYVVPLSYLRTNVLVLEHPSGTYTKTVATPGSNGWAHVTLNTMYYHPDYGPLAMHNSDNSGVFHCIWCHCHSPRTIYWCWDINLWPIPSLMQHHGAMVGLKWPSSPCIYPWIWTLAIQNLIYMWWIKLCGSIAIAQGQYNGVGISIWDLNQVCCNTREQWWAHMTIKTMHIPLT